MKANFTAEILAKEKCYARLLAGHCKKLKMRSFFERKIARKNLRSEDKKNCIEEVHREEFDSASVRVLSQIPKRVRNDVLLL